MTSNKCEELAKCHPDSTMWLQYGSSGYERQVRAAASKSPRARVGKMSPYSQGGRSHFRTCSGANQAIAFCLHPRRIARRLTALGNGCVDELSGQFIRKPYIVGIIGGRFCNVSRGGANRAWISMETQNFKRAAKWCVIAKRASSAPLSGNSAGNSSKQFFASRLRADLFRFPARWGGPRPYSFNEGSTL